MEEYQRLNQANWDERAPAHAASPGYAVDRFIADPSHLSDVIRFDLPRLGDLTGAQGVHLQCHIGTDTISLSRLGAHMTGLDFSSVSLEQARRLAAQTRTDVDFVEADVYAAVTTLGAEAFDLVYTGIGALCWLPDIRRWAQTVAGLLRPGGRLFIREGHPMLWALPDPREDGLLTLEYPYFETAAPIIWDEDGTYVETDAVFTHNRTHSWNHGLGEVATALIDTGMSLTALTEHDSVPWDALPGQMEKVAETEWRLIDRPSRLAHSYTLQAIKRDGAS